jgi:hypothetical protein
LEDQHEGQKGEVSMKRTGRKLSKKKASMKLSNEGHPLPGVVLLDLEDSEHDEEQMQAAWPLPTGAGLDSKNSMVNQTENCSNCRKLQWKNYSIRYQYSLFEIL